MYIKHKTKNTILEGYFLFDFGDDSCEWELIEDEEQALQLIAQQELQEKVDRSIANRRMYLKDTDWVITRQAEMGIPAPANILSLRQEARDEINELQNLTNLEDINNYDDERFILQL